MNVRLSRNSDIDTLVLLDRNANLTAWSKENYLGSFNNKQQNIYVLEEHGKIIGCLVVGIVLDEAEILQFWVDRNQHGKGYGHYLLTYILNELKTRYKVIQVFLDVRDGNNSAIKLYLKSGFIEVGRRRNYYLVDNWKFDAITMLKRFEGC